ncbi:MAG: hypothetical protein NC218_03560 [Acetobacter sp.]|nr:hypothetical protein [Acetobacter sp.]
MAQIKSNVKDQLDTGALALFSRIVSAEKDLVRQQEAFAVELAQLKQKEAAVKELREKLLPILSAAKAVDENGKNVTPYIENDFVRFSLVRGYQRDAIDVKQLQAVDPKLYKKLLEQYHKTESRKDTVKLTFKKIKIESE